MKQRRIEIHRFTLIIQNLQAARIAIIKQNREKKAKKPRKASKKKPSKPMSFASPELEAIFNNLPDDCKKLIRSGS